MHHIFLLQKKISSTICSFKMPGITENHKNSTNKAEKRHITFQMEQQDRAQRLNHH